MGARLHCPARTVAVQLKVPSVTVTVPVGVPPADATVKPTVTGWVANEGSGLTEVICVVVSAGPMAEATAANVALTALDPGTRASTDWAPAPVPSVQREEARPLMSVTAVSGAAVPPPAVTTKATRSWSTGRFCESVTWTTSESASACPSGAVWLFPATMAIAAGRLALGSMRSPPPQATARAAVRPVRLIGRGETTFGIGPTT